MGRIALALVIVAAVVAAGCGGSKAEPADVATVTATATAGPPRPTPAFTVVIGGISSGSSDVTSRDGLAPACTAANLAMTANGPVGATAMMTLGTSFRNRGSGACRLAGVSLRFEDASGVFARAAAIAPGREAYVSLVWTWRSGAEGPCLRRDPPAAFAVATIGREELRAPIAIALAPCEGRMAILASGLAE
ncbi:MAG TPA: hypothetical protein PKA49_07680 [Tepidiformaceae bacterium]|nr:hypothetical protein [Tepidiformaceae bacterium]